LILNVAFHRLLFRPPSYGFLPAKVVKISPFKTAVCTRWTYSSFVSPGRLAMLRSILRRSCGFPEVYHSLRFCVYSGFLRKRRFNFQCFIFAFIVVISFMAPPLRFATYSVLFRGGGCKKIISHIHIRLMLWRYLRQHPFLLR